jgi:predicted Zn finger-like uncharacterized protein
MQRRDAPEKWIYGGVQMTEITQCPECGTRFKVTDAQLDAHDGLVRCGHCQDVFNAREHLQYDEPSPQLSLPIEMESPKGEPVLIPPAVVPELEKEPTTLAQQVQFVEELTDEVLELPPSKPSWTGILIALTLTLALLAQGAYYFRVELAARLPGLKPLLVQYCELLACTVALPQKAELIVIESSELESDPNRSNIVTLHALVHNRAPYAQAYPSLELTLTDLQDQAVARRVFHPADYLKTGVDEKLGVPARRDLDIKLRLDTTDLKPSGYRLFLFYPQ